MKIFLTIVVGLLVALSVYFIGLSVSSRKQPDLGMLNERLRACPATPNCVSSEGQASDAYAYIEPLQTAATADDAWQKVKEIIVDLGGEMITEKDNYLHVLFVTPLMRYVDDLELRLDQTENVIHIRSASRVGHSDFGANRARVESIRNALKITTQSDH